MKTPGVQRRTERQIDRAREIECQRETNRDRETLELVR